MVFLGMTANVWDYVMNTTEVYQNLKKAGRKHLNMGNKSQLTI